jgi:hypothetical protein
VPTTVNNTEQQCAAGFWNGAVCQPLPQQCAAGEYWNGAGCVASPPNCASINGRASLLIAELRSLRARIEQTCSDPAGEDCKDAKLQMDGALLRYRMLLNETTAECRNVLPDPISF